LAAQGVYGPWTERVIFALILVNAVTLGLETSTTAMERYGPLLTAIDRLIIARRRDPRPPGRAAQRLLSRRLEHL
jgi:hypothetical protein